MIDLLDAPWIRDAEINGDDCVDDVKCPCCGAENPEAFYVYGSAVVGCTECLERTDPYEWVEEHKEEFNE